MREDRLIFRHSTGQVKTVREWSEETGIPLKVLLSRLYRGTSNEDMFLSMEELDKKTKARVRRSWITPKRAKEMNRG